MWKIFLSITKLNFCIHDGNQDGTTISKNLCLKFDNVPTAPSAFHCAPIKWMGTDPHNCCSSFSEPTNPQDSADKSPPNSRQRLALPSKGRIQLSFFHCAEPTHEQLYLFSGALQPNPSPQSPPLQCPQASTRLRFAQLGINGASKASSLWGSAESVTRITLGSGNQGKHPE